VTGSRLVVDPVACDGVGMCAHLAPDLVRLDSWGYPVGPGHGLSEEERRAAARAASGCPKRAMTVDD
jgi:ferredoxin